MWYFTIKIIFQFRRKLPIMGHVFGVHLSKSGICYASVVTHKGERQIQAFDRHGNLVKSFHSRTTKTGKPFEPYQVPVTVVIPKFSPNWFEPGTRRRLRSETVTRLTIATFVLILNLIYPIFFSSLFFESSWTAACIGVPHVYHGFPLFPFSGALSGCVFFPR